MAWTDPRTWLAGEEPTATVLNTHIRDNLKAIGDAWQSYTPVWGSSGTAPVVGNGSLLGNWISAGKLVIWRFSFTSGTTSTYGTGNYTITIPSAMINPVGYPVGSLTIQNVGTFYQRTLFSTGSATQMSGAAQDGTRWSQTVPFTPLAATAGYRWSGYGVYEAA
jgi:hypothetical protein